MNGTLVVLASAARTATTNSEVFTNFGARGILLIVDATVEVDTAEVTPSLQAYDPLSGKYATIWTAAAAISAVGTATYLLYPGASDGNMTEVDGIPLPAQFRVVMTAADADSLTYSVGAHLLI